MNIWHEHGFPFAVDPYSLRVFLQHMSIFAPKPPFIEINYIPFVFYNKIWQFHIITRIMKDHHWCLLACQAFYHKVTQLATTFDVIIGQKMGMISSPLFLYSIISAKLVFHVCFCRVLKHVGPLSISRTTSLWMYNTTKEFNYFPLYNTSSSLFLCTITLSH